MSEPRWGSRHWPTGPVEYVDVPLQRWSRSELMREIERLRGVVVRADEQVCHGNPDTAKRILREAFDGAL